MVKAATEAATAASGGKEDMIGKVVKVNAAGAAAKGGDEKSVNGIASGIKGIVEAAEKAGEEGKLKSEAAGDGGNADAGKLFAAKKKDAGGDAADAEKAAAAVSAVSGKQILKAIVDAAGKEEKGVADVKDAKNPIEAAIGSTGDNKTAAAFNKDGMKKNDQIAAAIVLRGMAKDGEFALKNDAANAEKGLKSTVESAVNKTVSGWLEEMVKAAQTAAGAANGDNTEIGKVVKVTGGAAAAKGGDEKSVNGIASGIKGIVEAAKKAGEEGKLESEAVAGGEANAEAGKLFAKKKANDGGGDAAAAEKAAAAVSAVSGKQILKAIVDAAGKEEKGVEDVKDATNPIAAAIGSTGDKDAAAFSQMKKNDQIAAAIVLRGMAKDGEFALKNADAANAEKGLKSTVESAVNKTVSGWLEEMAKAATEAATAASGDKGEMIGKVVKVNAAAAKGGDATSVNGIASGIKGIVEAAEKAGEEGKLESEAVAGAGEGNADAGKLFAKKNDDGDNGGGGAGDAEKAAAKGTAGKADGVQGAIAEISEWLEEMAKAAKDAATAANGDNTEIGKVVKVAAGAAAKGGDEKSVNGIAGGIKGIVEAAEKAGEEGKLESEAAAASEDNKDAGKLFAKKKDNNNGGGAAADAEKAAAKGTAGKADGVQGAIAEISKWLEEMAKAAKDAATAASGDKGDMIGKVVKVTGAGAAAKGGDEKSVNGIAGGIKGIVEAAEKAGKEGKLESEAVAGAGEGNADAGKLFAKKANDGGGAAKGDGEKKGVADVKEATNPIDAAIGSTDGDKDAAAFDKMKKNDQIAAAIVLRGMAKDGEFALKDDDHAKAEKGLKSTVESAVNKTVVVVRRDGKSC